MDTSRFAPEPELEQAPIGGDREVKRARARTRDGRLTLARRRGEPMDVDDAPSTGVASAPRRRRSVRRGGVVAVVGVRGALPRRLLRRLEEDERYTKLVLVDGRPPDFVVRRAVFHDVDLVQPLADVRLADVLRAEGADVLVYLARAEMPRARSGRAHEVETFGTMNLLNAAADCVLRRAPLCALVVPSTAMVYGARPSNPAYLGEAAPLRGGGAAGFVRDKVDAERQLDEFRAQFRLRVCVLRPCWVLGPDVSTIASRLLGGSASIAVLGYDPLLQLLHVDDLVDALKQAVDRRRDGSFNLAAPGALPLSVLFRLAGRAPWRVPGPLASAVSDLLWRSSGIGTGIPLDYLRHLWLVDDARARAELGFAPRYSTREVIRSFARRA
jgi:UDP-glucose 4-epimerase